MGSSKPPNHDMPFGYSFDGNNNLYPFPSPPAPAPGPSLLDDNESRFLDSFFDGVSSDHFNADFFSTVGDGMSDLGFPWQELPPNFMGTSTSFGQQPQLMGNNLSLGFSDMNGHLALAPTESLPSTTSADVLAAATLLQNGQNGRAHVLSNEAMYTPTPLPQSLGPTQPRNQNMMPYEQHHARPPPPKSDDYMRDTFFAEMVFGPSHAAQDAPKIPTKSSDIRWGSDSGFGSGQGFIAPPNQETLEKLEQNMTSALECFEAELSTANNTQPSSPIMTRYPEVPRRRSSKFERDDDTEDVDDSRSRKRRKSKTKEEDDGEEENGLSSKAPKKRRVKSVPGPSSSNTESPPPSKRRRSQASAAAKLTRENLTEDQKRENHIKSEQKRRTLIKEGFDDLNELVPELKGGGFSKSAVLIMAADWLEDMIKGNELLRARLAELEGRN